MKVIFTSFALLFLFAICGTAQEEHHATVHNQTEEHEFKNFRIALLMGHTFIPAGHTSAHTAIPSWGLDLEYWFNPNLGIGMHNDIELESFLIEIDDEEVIERVYPLVLTIDALWKPWKGLVFQVGPGYEFEEEENFFLVRAGVEYEFELPKHWDLAPSFFYDNRINGFNTWSITLGIGKRF